MSQFDIQTLIDTLEPAQCQQIDDAVQDMLRPAALLSAKSKSELQEQWKIDQDISKELASGLCMLVKEVDDEAYNAAMSAAIQYVMWTCAIDELNTKETHD